MNNLYISSLHTKIGNLFIAATEKGISHITLPHIQKKEFEAMINTDFSDHTIKTENALLKDAKRQVEKYFKGTLFEFDLPLDIQGTAFQKKVLNRVSKIKYGKTKTYGQIAIESGSEKAYRAVGSANAKNRIPIIIPCHRVVASSSLGGYAGGVRLKEKLLLLENENSL